jgi:hypothetical protein
MKATDRMPSLFNEAELPLPDATPPKRVQRRARPERPQPARHYPMRNVPPPAVDADVSVDALLARDHLPCAPTRPEWQSAQYWCEQMLAATDDARKAHCHEMMVLAVLALDRTPAEGSARH